MKKKKKQLTFTLDVRRGNVVCNNFEDNFNKHTKRELSETVVFCRVFSEPSTVANRLPNTLCLGFVSTDRWQ